MKLASYIADGRECYGVVVGDGVVTVGHGSLRDVLAAGGVDAIEKGIAGKQPDHKLGGIRFLPAIPNPHKILCAGVNYRDHAAEVGRELPKQPSLFIRFTDTLPKTRSGKIMRRLLRELATNGEVKGDTTTLEDFSVIAKLKEHDEV